MAQLPIYSDSYRPSSNWAKRLEDVQKSRPAEAVARAQARLLPGWVEGLRAYEPPPDGPPLAALERAARWLLARAAAKPDGHRDALTRADLEAACRALIGNNEGSHPVWRTDEGRPQVETHRPASPTVLPMLLDMTLDWFTTDAFAELHPVEQAGLFHLRMLDLQPFAAHSATLTRLLASFYTLRAGLPPLIPIAEEQSAYRDAVGYAFQMITQPGLELFARWLLAAYERIESEQEELK
ncbi:MAG: Fic family protein [Chloracidobacterium sp.]|nr:Fic family protein [Chloracidobacterium sp.]MDW8217649.1 Fic family protein [Acidobacteriota bacterium]